QGVELLELRADGLTFPVLLDAADKMRLRIERALRDLPLQHGSVDAKHCNADAGMARTGNFDRPDQVARSQAIDRRRRLQRTGFDANELPVLRPPPPILRLPPR